MKYIILNELIYVLGAILMAIGSWRALAAELLEGCSRVAITGAVEILLVEDNPRDAELTLRVHSPCISSPCITSFCLGLLTRKEILHFHIFPDQY